MPEPAWENGAGSYPSMMKTTCRLDGNHWVVNGCKAFITNADGAKVGIVMVKSEAVDGSGGAGLFVVDLPAPAIRIERGPDTIDSSMQSGHATVIIDHLRMPADQMLAESGEGVKYAQIRPSQARLSRCMRSHRARTRATEIATNYACRRQNFGKVLVDHEGVGFMLAANRTDLKHAGLMIDWCTGVLDAGSLCTVQISMRKVAVSEALMRIPVRIVHVVSGRGSHGHHGRAGLP